MGHFSMFAKGGHGFGMRKQNLPTDHWIDRFAEWLDLQGLLKKWDCRGTGFSLCSYDPPSSLYLDHFLSAPSL